MVALETPICDFGWNAIDFRLPGADGKTYSLDEVKGENGLLIVFMCNHCPYVKAVLDRIIRDARALADHGIGVVAINPNDETATPEDSFERMADLARRKDFPFPYLHDRDQTVARAYDAVCTPDFYGFNAALELQYRGRLDDAHRQETAGTRRELFDAMTLIARTGQGPREQFASMGCSIKWKSDAG